MTKKRLALLVTAVLFAPAVLHSANINVPSFELATRGYVQNGLFGFVSRGSLDLKIEGGVKFGGRITLSYESETLEDVTNLVGVVFKTAEIEMREVGGLPLGIEFFVGKHDTFASGDVFPDLFGTAQIATRYRGFFYFPDSIIYDGVHAVQGTGFAVHFPTGSERFLTSLYAYQDGRFLHDADGDTIEDDFFPGHYSFDIRSLLNFRSVKLEAFAGATIPTPDVPYGSYRGGLLFYAGEANVEFLAQIGMPRLAPTVDAVSINLFYLLFEPRVNLGIFHIIPTFFWHPQFYNQGVTGELGSFDVNLNFLFGSDERPEIAGGIEANLVLANGASTQELSVKVSPYVSLATPGVLWDLKVNANLFPFALESLVDVFLGIRAVF